MDALMCHQQRKIWEQLRLVLDSGKWGRGGEYVVPDPETFHLLRAAFYEGSESKVREQGKRN